jgi:hypothetical protein
MLHCRFKQHELIIKQGDLADRFYIVVGAPDELLAAGEAPSVVVTKTLPDDTEQEVCTLCQHSIKHAYCYYTLNHLRN